MDIPAISRIDVSPMAALRFIEPQGYPMNPNFGSESNISSTRVDGAEQIVIRHARLGVAHAGGVLFMCFWLIGWAFGEFSVLGQLLSGKAKAGPSLFMFVWLCGWTVGGAAVIWTIYRALRPTPETLTLASNGFLLDTGRPRLPFGRQNLSTKEMFGRRRLIEVNRNALSTLQLRVEPGNNRLTVDVGNERIDIAATATEIEREKLYAFLAARYHLAGQGAGTSAAQ
jgi:hypothetical protein